MHVQCNYTDVMLQNISRIQGYPSLPAEVIPQNLFPFLFQLSCDYACDPQDR